MLRACYAIEWGILSVSLRKHSENPIDWWYWCEEAIEISKNENTPIFLSIGYFSCHWCTVMEGEAFCDQAIATYLNLLVRERSYVDNATPSANGIAISNLVIS